MLEDYLNDPKTIWIVFLATAALCGALIDGLGRLIWKMRDMGRAWVITVPTTPGAMASIDRVRLKRGELTRKEPVNGDENELFIAHGEAAYPTRRGPLHLKSEYGANLVAPTKEQAIDAATDQPIANDAKTYHRFRIWDPLTYWRATRENDMEDLYAAQREKDHWAVKLAPLAIILFVGMLGFLGFILWKIMPLLQKAGAH